jgi:hypothetical protein
VRSVTSFNEWLPRRIDEANVLRLNEIVVPISPETSLGLIDLLRAWWEHLHKFEADLLASPDDRLIWGAHDYIAALIIRDHLAKAMLRVDPVLKHQADSVISEVDRRFTDFTEHDEDGCTERIEGRIDPSRDWWWKRVPKRGPVREEMQRYYGHEPN